MKFILNWLLHHLMFAGTMFFAAGASVLGGEGGASDGVSDQGDDSGSGDSSAEGLGSRGIGETVDGQSGDESAAAKLETQSKPQTHRAVLESFTKSDEFKALQTAKPEVAKAITRLQQSLRTVSEALAPLGGLKNAQKIAEVLSSAGGVEALTEMQGRLAEIDEIDQQLASGDPSYVNNIAENMPEEFVAMMPHAIDKFSELQPEAFTHLIAQNVVGALFSDDPDAPGIANLISRAFDLIGQNKVEDAQKLLKSVYTWCKNVRTQATTKPKPQAQTNDKTAQRETALQKKEQEFFDRSAGSQVESYSLPKMQSEIKRQFGSKQVSQETIDDMLESVTKEMTRRAVADQNFQRQVKAAREKRDEKRMVEISKQFADKNIPEAVKLIYGRRYRGMNIGQQVAKKNNNQQQGGPKVTPAAKAQTVAVKPKDSDLILNSNQLSADQRKALAEMGYKTIQQAIMNNIGFTKSGKVVQWQKDR